MAGEAPDADLLVMAAGAQAQRLAASRLAADFDESKHPRDEGGKFTSGGGGGGKGGEEKAPKAEGKGDDGGGKGGDKAAKGGDKAAKGGDKAAKNVAKLLSKRPTPEELAKGAARITTVEQFHDVGFNAGSDPHTTAAYMGLAREIAAQHTQRVRVNARLEILANPLSGETPKPGGERTMAYRLELGDENALSYAKGPDGSSGRETLVDELHYEYAMADERAREDMREKVAPKISEGDWAEVVAGADKRRRDELASFEREITDPIRDDGRALRRIQEEGQAGWDELNDVREDAPEGYERVDEDALFDLAAEAMTDVATERVAEEKLRGEALEEFRRSLASVRKITTDEAEEALRGES